MGLWDTVTDAVSDAVDTVTDAIDDGSEAIQGAVSDLFETVGTGLQEIIYYIPGVGGWLGDLVGSLFDFVAITLNGAICILQGFLTGTIKIVIGILILDKDMILEGFGDIIKNITGAVIMIFLQLAIVVQILTFQQGRERALTPTEKEILRKVFKKSLAVYNIRIVEGKTLFFRSDRPIAIGNTIYMKNKNTTTEPEVLVHECTHVWQYQHEGPRYTSDALGAQLGGDAYNWHSFAVNDGIEHWVDFNKESQAKFLEDLYVLGESLTNKNALIKKGDGVFFEADGKIILNRFMYDTSDYTDMANEAMNYIWGQTNFRVSQFFN